MDYSNYEKHSMKTCPLTFEPGTGWAYGAGIDWAGELVGCYSVLLVKPTHWYLS
jgi:hypothetical protein